MNSHQLHRDPRDPGYQLSVPANFSRKPKCPSFSLVANVIKIEGIWRGKKITFFEMKKKVPLCEQQLYDQPYKEQGAAGKSRDVNTLGGGGCS